MGDMIKGNVAIAEAAVRAGVKMYAGYPITPSSEIMEYLAKRLPELGRSFIQAESELSAINMVMGAAACGARALTASSGPGMSLKQEGISCISDEELACVVVNVVRYGNGLGTLYSAQCDYFRETRGGGNGDYRCIVLTPSSIQEAVELMFTAYELAEKYRIVTVFMTEGALGQMMEPCDMPGFIEPAKHGWGFDGKYSYKKIGIFDRDSRAEAVMLNQKHETIKANEQRWEAEHLADAEYVFVAYGLPGRAVKGAVRELRQTGQKVGFIRPITTWPFPEKAFRDAHPLVKGFITVEANATGQLVDDVALTVKSQIRDRYVPTYCLPCVYGIPTLKFIKDGLALIQGGELKERY